MNDQSKAKLRRVRRTLEANLPPSQGKQYALGTVANPYGDIMEYSAAVEHAAYWTAHRIADYLVMTNDAETIVAVFIGGKAYVPVELVGDEGGA